MSTRLRELIGHRHDEKSLSIASVCSANPYVIRAALELHRDLDKVALIEATSNQVNQYGGYTGMQPEEFLKNVRTISRDVGFPLEKLILGGDHLGPYPWRSEPEQEAMSKACTLVSEYVRAGFTKIHLDASMPLEGDTTDQRGQLSTEVGAQRAARLCQAAESARKSTKDGPLYVIGTEVPAPGGVSGHDDAPPVTTAAALDSTIEQTRDAFHQYGLEDAWRRVVAVVVQPGVEFTDHTVFAYERTQCAELRRALSTKPNLVFEGHSTDYQLPEHLQSMSEDSFAILKVGPALTFAFREAIFLLGCVETALADVGIFGSTTQIPHVLEQAMRSDPRHWRGYYEESGPRSSMNLLYSLSDRCRYYWSVPEVDLAAKELIARLEKNWPPSQLLRQFFPEQYWKVRRGSIEDTPQSYIVDRIQDVLRTYPGLS
jgi:D-tagatose-1,6-bisphosphate aldolase subunit GatZ/KbaZ